MSFAYHRLVAGAGVSYVVDHFAVYVDVPTIVTVFLSVKLAEVTIELCIHVDHGVAVVPPVTGPTETAVVSGHAPDQTVGPGIWYVVVQGTVCVFVSVEQ